jgi:hypothetical protein
MSFMVVNTGRVASQYFYINLKLQQNVIMPSRYQFDHVVKSYIKRRYKKPLYQFKKYQIQQLEKTPDAAFGIVFHSARRNLIYPLNSNRNINFLTELRDELGLETIFFPVRDPKAVFRSELNRQLARGLGDWSFPEGMNGWRKKWQLSEFALHTEQLLPHDDWSNYLPSHVDERDLKEISRKFIVETGKIFSLYELFSKIFPIVKIFDYKHLFDSPELVFEKIGHIAGFSLSDRSLVNTRLNGLANRFMLYNTFTLVVDNQTRKIWEDTGIQIGEKDGLIHEKISLKKIIIEKQNPFTRTCRFKFEIPQVLPVCEDWGRYRQVSLVSNSELRSARKILGSNIAIGAHADDLGNFSHGELDAMVKVIHRVICPGFEKNFQIMHEYYQKNVYYKDSPTGDLYKKFWKNCEHEYEKMNCILSTKDFL